MLVATALLLPLVPAAGAPREVAKPPAAPKAASSRSKAAEPAAPKVVRLTLLPPAVALHGPIATQRLLVMGTLADGRQVDLTAQAKLTTSAPKVIGVGGGKVSARSNGKGVLAARYGGKVAKVHVSVSGADRPVSYSFRNEVVPVLARLGCSQGTCHGANSGKGGFKLSLRGYAPELDFLSITREQAGRRISREAPEQSLLLRKALMEVPHGGGKPLEKGSPEYYTLLGWIMQGAAGPDESDPRLVSLQVFPGDRMYRPKETQRAVVQATFSDGTVRDVTDQTVFKSTDVGVADVTASGEVTALNPGATAVQAKYMDLLGVLQVTVPFPNKIAAAYPKAVNYVDSAVFRRLRELNLDVSPLCTDAEFVRRVYVDALGTLPTAEEARAFLDDPRPDKRDRLIEAVLQRPEYGSVWALKLCDVSMVRKEHMGRKYTVALNQWLTEQFRANRPWDELAADLIGVTGSVEEQPQALWWVSRQMTRPNSRGWVRHYELTAETVAQVFLGQRLQCAKCHNHPTEKYTQDDYYRFAALFAQVNGDGRGDPVPERLLPNDKGDVRHLRTGQIVTPMSLDRKPLLLKEGEDRRQAFLKWLHGDGRDLFSRSIANRVWARLFGIGIVDPVDDMSSANPPRNEALLAALAKDLVAHQYDLKYLMATIMKSRTYQSSAAATPANRVDSQFFSHYPARRLPAEELVDAIAQVTGVPDRYASYPIGTRAIELSDPELPSLALDTFGRPVRTTPCECDRSSAPSLTAALDLYNGEALQGKLKHGEGKLARLLKSGKKDPEIIEELYLTAFARRPDARELAAVQQALAQAPNRDEGMQDVLWALLNSKEFMFNH